MAQLAVNFSLSRRRHGGAGPRVRGASSSGKDRASLLPARMPGSGRGAVLARCSHRKRPRIFPRFLCGTNRYPSNSKGTTSEIVVKALCCFFEHFRRKKGHLVLQCRGNYLQALQSGRGDVLAERVFVVWWCFTNTFIVVIHTCDKICRALGNFASMPLLTSANGGCAAQRCSQTIEKVTPQPSTEGVHPESSKGDRGRHP